MIEALYFSCYYAYLQGNLEKATLYYALLKEEFKDTGNKGSLKEHQYYELKRVKEAIKTGSIVRAHWLDEPDVQGPPVQPTAECKQYDLMKIIDKNVDQLREFYKDDLNLYNIEHPCGPYGRVDMVYMGSSGTVYPIEVKKDQGRHDLIGQVSKYELFYRLHLHYKFYSLIKMGTICSSYDPFALKELKQLGVNTFVYSLKKDKLNLTLI